jgi:hypothetical protein
MPSGVCELRVSCVIDARAVPKPVKAPGAKGAFVDACVASMRTRATAGSPNMYGSLPLPPAAAAPPPEPRDESDLVRVRV